MPWVHRHMSRDVMTIPREDTLEQAAKAMTQTRVGSALVVEGTRVVGIVTERDVMRLVASGVDPREARIDQCMTPDPVSVTPHTETSKAAGIMFERGFRHLPVIEDGELVGIVSSRDLLRAAEQEAARQSAVIARDGERRRIERDIHDGAQQHLVALRMKLHAAAKLLEEREEGRRLLSELQAQIDAALDTLRDLASGNYQGLLDDLGVASALEAHARRAGIPVQIDARTVERLDPQIEAAIYFCCLEALQNISKHAAASHARITIEQSGGEVRFWISDDGVGFNMAGVQRGAGHRNIAERLDALDGELEIRSAPGDGTTLIGRIPLRASAKTR